MQAYLIVTDRIPKSEITATFPDHYELGESVFVIASADKTCSDVSGKLKLNNPPTDRSGVVVKINEYYGLYDAALWQKIESWKAQP